MFPGCGSEKMSHLFSTLVVKEEQGWEGLWTAGGILKVNNTVIKKFEITVLWRLQKLVVTIYISFIWNGNNTNCTVWFIFSDGSNITASVYCDCLFCDVKIRVRCSVK